MSLRKCIEDLCEPDVSRVKPGYVVREVWHMGTSEVAFWAGYEPPGTRAPSEPDGFSRTALKGGGFLLTVTAKFYGPVMVCPGDVVTHIDGAGVHFLGGGVFP